jgi:hypothetical protein
LLFLGEADAAITIMLAARRVGGLAVGIHRHRPELVAHAVVRGHDFNGHLALPGQLRQRNGAENAGLRWRIHGE